jgi:hypothetical protein
MKQIHLPKTFVFEDIKENYNPLVDLLDDLNDLSPTPDIEITVKKIKQGKTYQQLRGFHRLLNLIAEFCEDQSGERCDMEMAKQLIKNRYGYYKENHGAITYLSCTYASKEVMMGLIRAAEDFGIEFKIPGCVLTSAEERAFNNFYEVEND